MPSILEVWKAGKLEKGAKIEVPIQKREITLPYIITGVEDQSLSTNDIIKAPDGSVPLTKCTCTCTGELDVNSQLLLIGEVLPIPITLADSIGGINGSVAINLACAALLSIPNQMIAAKSINLSILQKYSQIAPGGEYQSESYWINEYYSICNIAGNTNMGGMYSIYNGMRDHTDMFEVTFQKGKKTSYKNSKYTKVIRPVYHITVYNPQLEMNKRNGIWVIKP